MPKLLENGHVNAKILLVNGLLGSTLSSSTYCSSSTVFSEAFLFLEDAQVLAMVLLSEDPVIQLTITCSFAFDYVNTLLHITLLLSVFGSTNHHLEPPLPIFQANFCFHRYHKSCWCSSPLLPVYLPPSRANGFTSPKMDFRA